VWCGHARDADGVDVAVEQQCAAAAAAACARHHVWPAGLHLVEPKLKEHGVGAVFLPGTSTEDIIKYIRENVKARD
jgi:methylmalonyl-CoA mutase cobalamin-binding subunit